MRYIEVVGGIGVWRCELLDGEPLAGYTGYNREVMNIGEFTRENIAKYLEVCLGPGAFPVEDFHAVCDGMEIPWAAEEGRETYRRVMELAAAKAKADR